MRTLLSIVLLALVSSSAILAQELVEGYATNIDASGEAFVYYSISEERIATEQEASFGAWDIAFQGTNIKFNGVSQLLPVAYDAMTEAPKEGYTEGENGASELPTDADSRWFDYDFNTHVITPISERTVVFKTRDGHYAKFHVNDYYKVVFGSDPVPRMYSFKYAIQTDGSTNLQ